MRRLLALLFVLGVALPAQAEDLADELRRLDSSAAGDTAVETRLAEIEGDDKTSSSDLTIAADAALELLPPESGHRVAGALVLRALRRNPQDRDAWYAAFRVQKRMAIGIDVENGVPYIEALIALYPEQIDFRRALGSLLLDGGRPAAARELFEGIRATAPDDTRSRYQLAVLAELDGDSDEAIRLYDEIIASSGALYAHMMKTNLLWSRKRDFDAARVSLSVGRLAVEKAEGRQREEYRGRFQREERALEDAATQRKQLAGVKRRLDRLALAAIACWIVALLSGGWLLRRRGWL